jgi:lysyl-tRNA synthetase class 2
VIGGTAIVTGDPIGDPAERRELISEFRRVAHAKAWRVAVAGAATEALPDYAELGFKSIYLGDEAFVDPQRFSLDGRPIRKVRQSVTRLVKAGYRVELLAPDDVEPAVRDELRSVSEEWRGRWPERGFTMAMDALFAYPDTMLAIAKGPDGRVGGFLQLVPAPACGGYSLASMRRRRETPNGLMEFLIVETIAWARGQGVRELSLNFSVFAEYLRGKGVLRAVLLKLDRLFQLERLHSFNRKFFPEWRHRYFCFERWSDLPIAGVAYLHAESLLTPPGPWARTHDLTTH